MTDGDDCFGIQTRKFIDCWCQRLLYTGGWDTLPLSRSEKEVVFGIDYSYTVVLIQLRVVVKARDVASNQLRVQLLEIIMSAAKANGMPIDIVYK
jgi:hypothetical protein